MSDLFNEGYEEGYKDGVKECEPYMREWISVNDKLPEFDIPVLIYHHDNPHYYDSKIEVAKIDSHQKWVIPHFCESSYMEKVTHWMTLPNPPPKEDTKHE